MNNIQDFCANCNYSHEAHMIKNLQSVIMGMQSNLNISAFSTAFNRVAADASQTYMVCDYFSKKWPVIVEPQPPDKHDFQNVVMDKQL